MTIAAFRNCLLSAGLVFVLGTTSMPVAAAQDGSSGATPVVQGDPGRQLWRISEYTTIELVAREPGAPGNQHPWTMAPNALHALLQQVQLAQATRGGLGKPLFAIDELSRIVPAIAEALANARPDQDIALVSSARHEDNTFDDVTAVTARLFVVDGHLNLIVHDARVDFYAAARASGMAPHFTVGSRTSEGRSSVRSPSATNKRSDWLVLAAASAPLAAPAVAAPVSPVVPPSPVTPPAPVVPPAPVMPPPVVAPPAVGASAPVPVAATDVEQRLVERECLHDSGRVGTCEDGNKRARINTSA